jgi:hypothetical protein
MTCAVWNRRPCRHQPSRRRLKYHYNDEDSPFRNDKAKMLNPQCSISTRTPPSSRSFGGAVGAGIDGTSNGLHVAVDEVILFDRALVPAEVPRRSAPHAPRRCGNWNWPRSPRPAGMKSRMRLGAAGPRPKKAAAKPPVHSALRTDQWDSDPEPEWVSRRQLRLFAGVSDSWHVATEGKPSLAGQLPG